MAKPKFEIGDRVFLVKDNEVLVDDVYLVEANVCKENEYYAYVHDIIDQIPGNKCKLFNFRTRTYKTVPETDLIKATNN